MDSFLLIGQSNMAGRGYIRDAVPIDCSRIYTLRNGRWQKMFRPINPDRSTSGVSLAESFALSYSNKYSCDVGLICCADGGTSIEQWAPGGVLFENAVNMTLLAMRSSNLKGILWHQGETDCSYEKYPKYAERFNAFIISLKQRLGIDTVPIIIGGLGDFLAECSMDENLKNYTYINEILESIADANSEIAYVTARGLTSNHDCLHFNSASLYEFGLRYFAEYEKLSDSLKLSHADMQSTDINLSEIEKL